MKNQLMEERFFTVNRWKPGKECLNMEDINQPPPDYEGCFKEWIQELTTFVFLYPEEWKEIYAEYRIKNPSSAYMTGLAFFRNEEGYLRKELEQDIFLRIHLGHINREIRELVEKWIDGGEILTFEGYLTYCKLDFLRRKTFLQGLKERLNLKLHQRLKRQNKNSKESMISISFESDYDNSAFERNEFYIDVLNDTYIIL